MSRNDARDFADRIYSRIPAHYRVHDAERGQPLLALITVVASQVAELRQNLDDLWDDFFIETCDDWAVPYIGALVGTHLLQTPVGQSNRLDVWNTVLWRRSKGTPQMLDALARSITGWPLDLAEWFLNLGWSQNMNHVRLDRPLLPDLRSPGRLQLLGHADDPFAHAADFRPASFGDQPRTVAGVGAVAAWGTPGRYQIRNLAIFVRRLRSFAVRGATPSATTATAGNTLFQFDPLSRDVPLYTADEAKPISRAAMSAGLGRSDVTVRQYGIPLTRSAPAAIQAAPVAAGQPFQFGAINPVQLDAAAGMRLTDPAAFQLGGSHFLITAHWSPVNGTPAAAGPSLGTLSTLKAAAGAASFAAGVNGSGAGQLAITLQTGRNGAGFNSTLPTSGAARFPGAVVALRAARSGPLHLSDTVYAHLPATFVNVGSVLTFYIAADGSSYTASNLAPATLARDSESQAVPSTRAVDGFSALLRTANGMAIPDPGRFAGAGVVLQAALFTGTQFVTLGGIATAAVATPATTVPDLQTPVPWPALEYAASKAALNGTAPQAGTLTLLMQPAAAGGFIPASEVVLTSRTGQSLLVYLPEVAQAPASGVRVMVAEDGSTYFFLPALSMNALNLARAAQGQVLPIAGLWPLAQRVLIVLNLCRVERATLVNAGQVGIDPELGRFALAAGDPALSHGSFTVDYVHALADTIGATSAHATDTAQATRWVAQAGDAPGADTLAAGAPVHTTLADAVSAAQDGDVIEILDSATYLSSTAITLSNPAVRRLTIRAAGGQRPCLTGGITVTTTMDALSLAGLLISAGPLRIQGAVSSLRLDECTLDPAQTAPALIGLDANAATGASWTLARCITGGIVAAAGIRDLTLTDSIVDHSAAFAITGAQNVQMERTTVLGQLSCQVLRASECLLDAVAVVQDQQAGCVRYSRFEPGSVLPRRFRSIPDDEQLQACSKAGRCLAPLFTSRKFGNPGYGQLAANCPVEIREGSEAGSEIGAFAASRNSLRLANLKTKLQEFLPVGLVPVVVNET